MIGLHVGQVEYGGQSWHADPKCFKCEFCHDPLLNRSFLPKFGYVYCSHKCAVRFEQQNHNNQGHGGESFNHKFAPTQLALPPNSSCEMHRQGIHHSGPGPGPGTGRIKAASANQPTQHSFYNKTFDSNTLNQPSNVNNNNNHNQNAQLTNQTSNSHIDPLYESINLGRDLNILTLPDDPSKPLSARPISPAQTAISRKQSDPEKERISGNLPPVPPKRTNSQLSSHSSVNFPAAPNMGNTRQDSGIEGGVRENKSVSVNLTGSLNKSVNFSQYPIHSDTSSINDGTTTIGNQSVTTEKPKSILKNKKDSNFNRNDVFGASIRRGISDNDHPGDRSFNKQFSHKSRRVKSIEQGLNKSWGGPKGQGNGYYSDTNNPSDSSSTLGESEDEFDTNGDWEREAIALAHSKVINSVTPTSRSSRKDFVAQNQKKPEITHSNYSYNLDQFEKTSKKLKKQRKKQKKLLGKSGGSGKNGKPCTIQ